MEKIDSKENISYKNWLKLLSKKGRENQGLFLFESIRGMEEGAAFGVLPDVILVNDSEVVLPNFLESLERVVVLKESLFNSLTETRKTQGVIGVYKQKRETLEILNDKKRVVYLDGIQDPGNLGTIIRSAVALQFEAVLLGPGCVDHYNGKVLRSSLGGVFFLPILTVGTEELLSLKGEGYNFVASDLKGQPITQKSWKKEKIVLGIGNENKGLSTSFLELCDDVVTIPIKGIESLNAGVAASILMFEYSRE